jgi:hypothetical protein
MPGDLLSDLEHDHVPLSHAVGELRALLSDETGELHARFAGRIREVRDLVIDHFGKEEQGLFPFLATHVPALAAEVRALSAAHDNICGAAVRLAVLAEKDGPSFRAALPLVRSVFDRFEAAYTEHARVEVALLRSAQAALTADELREVAELTREL